MTPLSFCDHLYGLLWRLAVGNQASPSLALTSPALQPRPPPGMAGSWWPVAGVVDLAGGSGGHGGKHAHVASAPLQPEVSSRRRLGELSLHLADLQPN